MPEAFLAMITIFILSAFVGLEVIKKVSPLLHTPLMSLTNAISAISIVGAILVAGSGSHHSTVGTVLGGIAVFCSMTNIVSGFLITDRMLKMFKKKPDAKVKTAAGTGHAS
jgi:NAD(P) transhydrogenase subunit alpha